MIEDSAGDDDTPDEDVVHVPPPDLLRELPEDERYLTLLLTPLRACANYRPKFGRKGKLGLSREEFQRLYSSDPFYHWIGLDSPLMYAAHKAAGGMTSVYRQLGIGTQWILNQVLQDHLGLTKEQANWTYTVPSAKGKPRQLSLDGRIEPANIQDRTKRRRVEKWLSRAADKALVSSGAKTNLKGAVFETRQGYKSKDSKRQNADIANASNAYANLYLPVLTICSLQIDEDVAARYVQAQWVLLRGTVEGSDTESTYGFARNVVGYDVAGFFQRNSGRIKTEVETILKSLLST